MALKLLWLEPKVIFNGKGIITVWGEEMARKGWELVKELPCDLAFAGSDSQLEGREALIGQAPTIVYFWGWPPWRLLEPAFRQFAEARLGVMARCTRILVPSPSVQDQCLNFGLPAFICEPGVDTAIQGPGDGPIERRVIFISRLVPHKGIHTLMQALSLLQPKVPLLVIGPGDREPYQDMASQLGLEVAFAEPEDPEKVFELRRSTVLVHPSSYEGFGLPPVEALYHGVPVVALDTPHMRWLLQEDAFYFSSVEGLAGTLAQVLSNPRDGLARAARARQRIANYLTLEHACDRLWAHIHQTIKAFWAGVIREDPSRWKEAYDKEHVRNWAYSVERLSPDWFRHWRAQYVKREVVGPRVLDIGAGAGTYTIMLAREGHRVTWQDISEEAMRQAEALTEKFGVRDRVDFCLGDAQSLPLPDGCYDSVWAGEILEHVPHPEKVIAEALRVLKPGGRLILSTPVGEHHWDPFHQGPARGGWDDQTLRELLKPWEGQVKRLEKIAEEGAQPSCFLIVLEKQQ